MRKTWGRLGIAITAIAVGLGANAQTQTVKQPKTLTVGVNLDSNYDRITEFLPMVRDSVLKAIPRDRKQVKTVALRGSAQDATEAARKQGCDYLLQIDVVEIRGAAVDFSTRQFSEEIGPDERRERQELAWVGINYHLLSLNNDDVDVQDLDHVRYAEYPSGWNNTAFQTSVIRAVTRVAVSAVNTNLPKK
jgi:hypothetical protein